jgi:hypothetical protein
VEYIATVTSNVYGMTASAAATSLVAMLQAAIDAGTFDAQLASIVASNSFPTVGMSGVTSGNASLLAFSNLAPTTAPTVKPTAAPFSDDVITPHSSETSHVFYEDFPIYGKVLFPFGCIVVGLLLFYVLWRYFLRSLVYGRESASSPYLRSDRLLSFVGLVMFLLDCG